MHCKHNQNQSFRKQYFTVLFVTSWCNVLIFCASAFWAAKSVLLSTTLYHKKRILSILKLVSYIHCPFVFIGRITVILSKPKLDLLSKANLQLRGKLIGWRDKTESEHPF